MSTQTKPNRSLEQKRFEGATKALTAWNDREADERYGISMDSPMNWREAIAKPHEQGDVTAMSAAAQPDVQMQMTRLCFSKDQRISLAACTFILGQGGHGPVSKVEHSLDYTKLPADQLVALLQSKLMNIQRLNPNFDLQKLISNSGQQVIDVEAIESIEQELEDELEQEEESSTDE